MTRDAAGRPGPDEFAPYYARYVTGVPDGDPLVLLESEAEQTRRLLEAIGDERAGAAYAPGKWSVKDVVVHLADTERIMAYRALRIARGDETPLPGFEQDDYARTAGANARPLADLLAELAAVRAATVALFRGLDAAAYGRRGTASGHSVTVRGLLYIILGHDAHHRRLLAQTLLAAGTPAAV